MGDKNVVDELDVQAVLDGDAPVPATTDEAAIQEAGDAPTNDFEDEIVGQSETIGDASALTLEDEVASRKRDIRGQFAENAAGKESRKRGDAPAPEEAAPEAEADEADED